MILNGIEVEDGDAYLEDEEDIAKEKDITSVYDTTKPQYIKTKRNTKLSIGLVCLILLGVVVFISLSVKETDNVDTTNTVDVVEDITTTNTNTNTISTSMNYDLFNIKNNEEDNSIEVEDTDVKEDIKNTEQIEVIATEIQKEADLVIGPYYSASQLPRT